VILRLTLFHESNCFSPSNQTLPDNPGVYQYYDKEDFVCRKAKNLKKRVSSYFNKIHDTAKTNVLVKKIVTIKHIVVPKPMRFYWKNI
jgi:excinuclease UvrABC nuclease subunit